MVGCAALQGDREPRQEPWSASEFAQISVPKPSPNNQDDTASTGLPHFQSISRPTAAEWLLEPSNVFVRDLPAQQALHLVTAGSSIRFNLSLDDMPFVSLRDTQSQTIHDTIQAICRGADWRCEFENGALVVRDLETRTFPILAQPGAVDGQLSVNSLNNDESNQFIDGEAVAFSDYNAYTRELQPLIEGLLVHDSAQGVPVQHQLLPRANAVLVTARPSTITKVADVLAEYNDRTAKLVRVFLTVFEVATASKQSVGSRLSALRLGSNLSNSVGWSVLPQLRDGLFQMVVTDSASPWRGGELLFEWLNSEGEATVNLNDQLDVRNNRIASSSSTRTFQYIASITRELDNLGRERTEVSRAQLRTGWAISVHPTIGLDRVTVRLSLARRALVEERPFAFGDTTGTNFVTDDQNRSMSVTLRDGEARLITLLSSADKRKRRNKLAGLVTSRDHENAITESVILMRVELI